MSKAHATPAEINAIAALLPAACMEPLTTMDFCGDQILVLPVSKRLAHLANCTGTNRAIDAAFFAAASPFVIDRLLNDYVCLLSALSVCVGSGGGHESLSSAAALLEELRAADRVPGPVVAPEETAS